MHELSICASIADIARRRARRPARSSVINLRVGQLRQIVPDTLVYCWSLISEDTSLAGSVIVVERCPPHPVPVPPATARRRRAAAFACAACGGIDVELVAGEEFLITVARAGEGGGADGTVPPARRRHRACARPRRRARPRSRRVGDHSGYRDRRERVEVLERIFGENDRPRRRTGPSSRPPASRRST